ncbi:MAG: PQQ-dependent sugar dehydrogenase [Acidobacteriia bacterium]|nr:PQQ-dependent sugar dehydrogenase [Terriglobia bacterium]
MAAGPAADGKVRSITHAERTQNRRRLAFRYSGSMKTLMAAGLVLAMQLAGQEIRLVQAATGIGAPTDIQNAGDGSGRLFFVQQNGIVRLFRNGVLSLQPFLDISAKTRANGELGLLGLAFSPRFAQNGRLYVDYTDLSGNTVIAQYRLSSNPDVADPTSEIALLHIAQPFVNHKGGQIRFGPDGYLYIGMGDGGSAGDPLHNGQSLGTLLGKLLRIDVESDPGHVRIPPDNPFVNSAGARPEIWAYGLRNPWRFSFDSATNDLWIADVGQDTYEEIDYQPASSHGGENYGWSLMEGMHCYVLGCNTQGLTLPVVEYSHIVGGCSVTGAFVYRGQVSPGLRGTYLYADYCSGIVWGLSHEGGGWTSRRLTTAAGFNITTFGQDEAGELYVADAASGTIYHVVGSTAPRIAVGGVVNSASFVPGLVAGSLATVFAAGVLDAPGVVMAGQIPVAASLNGVSVTVNGTAAPIYALANSNGLELVNFQVPFEVAGQTTASVVVSRGGQASPAVAAPVLDVQPAVYTNDATLTQAVVVHNADYTLVTAAHPLQRGEFAFLYAAGLGRVANQPQTGAAAPASPPLASVPGNVQVTLAGLACEVEYAGLAPGLVGVYQVNFRVPANAPGGSGDLVVTAGSAKSPAVKVPVQ